MKAGSLFSRVLTHGVTGALQEILLGSQKVTSKASFLNKHSDNFAKLIGHRLEHNYTNYHLPVHSKIKPKVFKRPVKELLDFPQDPSLVCRGSGADELKNLLHTNKLGHSTSSKGATHNIPRHIVENDCQGLLISTTPDFGQAGVYSRMSGFLPSLIPTHGFVAVMNPNKVVTDPRMHSILNPQLYLEYAEHLVNKAELDNLRRHDSVLNMAHDAKEITGFIVLPNGLNVCNNFNNDVQKIYIIDGLSRIRFPFMSANETAHIEQWDNPGFKKECIPCWFFL